MRPDTTNKPELEAAKEPIGGRIEFVDGPEYRSALANEFPAGAAEWTDPVSRRQFMGLMGASIALAGAAGCLRPAMPRKIVPYVQQPDEMTPGNPLFFATAVPLGGYGLGVLVRSREGRPIKIEGNPDHPSSLGGVGIQAQATILDLYDPDRSKSVLHNGLPTSYEQAVTAVRKLLYAENGDPIAAKRIRILCEPITSPTLIAQLGELQKAFPQAKLAMHDPVGLDNVREGIRKAFGKPLAVSYDFKKADIVLALDSDFLCMGPGQVRYNRDFASRRKVRVHKEDGGTPEKMSRVYAVECMPTLTGAAADHRLALASAQIEAFALELAAELGVPAPRSTAKLPEEARAWIKPMADDLRLAERKGKTLVIAGDHLPAHVHALVFAINAHLGNLGQTVIQTPSVELPPSDKIISLKTLTQEMAAKQVDALFIFSTNPAYTAPADVPFARATENVPFKLHLGAYVDETAILCEWHIPEAHYLEAWGDIRGHDGTATIQQPLIKPLYNGKSIIEFLADVSHAPYREGLDIVKEHWRKEFAATKKGGEFEVFWQESVRSGVVQGFTPAANSVPLAGGWAEGYPAPPALPAEGQYEIDFRADPTIYDGRFANNGWLQELPKPLTLICWENVAYMSRKTAEKLGVDVYYRWTGGEHGRADVTVVELSYKGQKMKVPAWILPGHADGAVTVHLGYGRTRAGNYVAKPAEPNVEGQHVRGFNAYALRTSDALWFGPGLTLAHTSDTAFVAQVGGHWSMLDKDFTTGEYRDRKPVRRGTVDDYRKNPKFAKITPEAADHTDLINENVPGPEKHSHDHGDEHAHGEEPHDPRLKPLTMYNPNEALSPDAKDAQRHRWAMAIDLAACTGCSSCMIACQSENNIPVVGKKEVTRGRIMHWIRIDRYYGGPQETPDAGVTMFQPVACVQCEKAPCEVVCPVGATVHSVDGLNDMVYNRCVGTRYCSNNCPYKVRRFNFLTFADFNTESLKLGRNPEVTVRSRGVMEKCTFCVQRIRAAEIVAAREERQINDGEIMTACQAACPTGAIVFGDLDDAHSVVARWKEEPTNYGLLAELNTRPRLTHLAALRNPNPNMPKGA